MANRSTITIKVEGLRECEEALTDLINTAGVSTATGKNTVRRAMKLALEPIRDAMIAGAPVHRGRLKAGIDISTQLTKTQRSKHVKESPVEMFVGAKALPYAHMQEFGTARTPPRPFGRPAVDSNLPRVITLFSEHLWSEILKTAERHARKAARLLTRSS